MKKVAYVIVTIGVIVVLLGLFFKMYHWEGSVIFLYGSIFSWIIAFPLIAIILLKGKAANKNTNLFGTISAFILFVGIYFKILHYPASEQIQAVGTVLFIVFSILFALNLYKSPKE
ncbi:MAG: hypothetical protein NTX61_18785 [Bacteroidetes bacterium]|nr:hypothetical protein [Bacteroidota bacterium]